MNDLLSNIDGLLIDIDGVLMIGDEVIPGATETIAALRARGIPFRFMTNSTIYCRYTLAEKMRARGFPVELNELYTATYVAARYLRDREARSYFPCCCLTPNWSSPASTWTKSSRSTWSSATWAPASPFLASTGPSAPC